MPKYNVLDILLIMISANFSERYIIAKIIINEIDDIISLYLEKCFISWLTPIKILFFAEFKSLSFKWSEFSIMGRS